jgi:hypothetical protein
VAPPPTRRRLQRDGWGHEEEEKQRQQEEAWQADGCTGIGGRGRLLPATGGAAAIGG